MSSRTPFALTLLLSGSVALCAASCSDLGISGDSVKSTASPIRAAEPTPTVRITSPERATFHGEGVITVSGSVAAVDSGAPVDALFVQGMAVALQPDGTFTTTATLDQGLNILRAEATDSRGRIGVSEVGVLAGSWAPLSQPIPNAIGMRLNNPALDAVAAILEPIVANADLNVLTQAPVYNGSLLAGTVTAVVTLANPKMQLTPPARIFGAADGLHVEVAMQDLSVDVTASGTIIGVGVGPEQAAVKADGALVEATVQVYLEPDRTVAVRVVSSSVDFINFQANATGSALMNAILPLLRGWIETRVEDLLANKIVDLGNSLNAVLQGVLNPPQPPQVFGIPVPYASKGEQVTHDVDGVSLLLEFDAPPLQVSPRAARAPGSLSTTSATPPTASTTRGVSVVVDDDMLNRLLHSVWAAGTLDDAVEALIATLSVGGRPLSVGDAARFLPELLLVASPDATLTFEIESGLPPILEVTGTPDLARLSLGEVYVTVFVDEGVGPELLATLAVSARAGVDLALETGGIRFTSNSQLPEISVDVLEEPLGKVDQGRLRTVLGTVVPLLVPRAIDLIGLVPIPSAFPPNTFQNLQAYQDGADGQRLKVELDMLR